MAQLASEDLQKLKLTSKLGRVWQRKKRRTPTKIYQKEVFYKPKMLYIELTDKLRIGYIYHDNICLCNICTGYKCHYSIVCATIFIMYQF